MLLLTVAAAFAMLCLLHTDTATAQIAEQVSDLQPVRYESPFKSFNRVLIGNGNLIGTALLDLPGLARRIPRFLKPA